MALTGCFGRFEGAPSTSLATRPPDAQPVPKGPPAEVMPLQPGARYEYAARYGIGAGQLSGQAVLSVLDAWRQGDSETARVAVVSSYAGRVRHDEYLFVREGGWIGLRERPAPAPPTAFLPEQLVGAAPWSVHTGEGTGTATLEGREDLQLATGRFKGCYRVRYHNAGNGTDWVLWLAPAVGLVQADVNMQLGPLPLAAHLWLVGRDTALGS